MSRTEWLRGPGTVVLALVAFGLSGCWGRRDVSGDELVPSLRSTHYRFTWRKAPRPPGVEHVVAGRATDSRGTTLDFAATVYDGQPGDEPPPVVAHASDGFFGCANYRLVSNVQDASVSRRVQSRRFEMERTMAQALEKHLRGYHCEG